MHTAEILDEKQITGSIQRAASADAIILLDTTWRSTSTPRRYVEVKMRVVGGSYAGDHHLLLCTDDGKSPAGHQGRLPLRAEFDVMRAAFKEGVAVPEPLWLFDDADAAPFYVMREIKERVADPSRATAWSAVSSLSVDACRAFGANLSKLHRIRPPSADLSPLVPTCCSYAMHQVEGCRRALDAVEDPLPALEWTLRWLEKRLPKAETAALCHGNYCVESSIGEGGGPSYILNWEQAGWGNPYQDIASFLTSINYRTVKGPNGHWAKVFCDSYQEESGEPLDFAHLAFWEVMGKVNRCVKICRQPDQSRAGGTLQIKQLLESRIRSKLELDILTHIDTITTRVNQW